MEVLLLKDTHLEVAKIEKEEFKTWPEKSSHICKKCADFPRVHAKKGWWGCTTCNFVTHSPQFHFRRREIHVEEQLAFAFDSPT